MVPAAVDEDAEASSSTFPLLMQRESPMVLRKVVTSWSDSSFLQAVVKGESASCAPSESSSGRLGGGWLEVGRCPKIMILAEPFYHTHFAAVTLANTPLRERLQRTPIQQELTTRSNAKENVDLLLTGSGGAPYPFQAAFQAHLDAQNLRTTWRLHPLGVSTVWESDCRFLEASVRHFLEWEGSTEPLSPSNPFAPYERQTHWAYADYKHLKELEDDWAEALEPLIDWSALGCEKSATDSTLWLGTGGSHTPLHYDTYGVNLVAQLHGRKKWLLYPPSATASLSPTRVPYEESSVFSQVDARSPDIRRFPRYAEAHPLAVTLEPGDVLFVPKHWWHFVEAAETSLSVNVWVDAPGDSEDRAKESVARVLMTSLASGLDAEVGPGWLNPTEGEAWPLEETLAVARLAFQGLDASADEADGDGQGGEARVPTGDAFSVRAMVDAVTAPDILQMIASRISQRKG